MIKYIDGDLLLSDCSTILHQANCFSTMGAGIAKSIADKHPSVQRADKDLEMTPENRFGWFSGASLANGQTIINLYGQYRFGRGKQTDYTKLELSMDRLFKWGKLNPSKIDLSKVGVPYKMGCGLAGGDWDIVSKILEGLSEKHNIDIYVYKLD